MFCYQVLWNKLPSKLAAQNNSQFNYFSSFWGTGIQVGFIWAILLLQASSTRHSGIQLKDDLAWKVHDDPLPVLNALTTELGA